MAITVYKQKTINKNWKQKKNPKKISEKKKSKKEFRNFYYKDENQHKQITNHHISCENRKKKNPR